MAESLIVFAEDLVHHRQYTKNLKNLDLLNYFFDPPIIGTSKMKNAQLVVAVEELLEIYKASRFEA